MASPIIERTPGLDGMLDRIQILQIRLAMANRTMRQHMARRTQQQERHRAMIQREIEKLEPALEGGYISDRDMLALVMLWDSRRFYAEEHYELREANSQLQLLNIQDIETVNERADILDESIIVE